jgi:protease I
MVEPRKALDEAGAQTVLISPKAGEVKGWQHTNWGDSFTVDLALADANPKDYAALLLPGGVMNPDRLRIDDKAIAFTRPSWMPANPLLPYAMDRGR